MVEDDDVPAPAPPQLMPDAAETAAGVAALLNVRQRTHGDFDRVAFIAQQFKALIRTALADRALIPPALEGLDLIATKLARILSGDPYFPDHWDDIAGYSRLVADLLRAQR